MSKKSALPNGTALNGIVAGKQRIPYPDHQDSGIEWLGQVPAHWNIDRLKWSVSGCQNGVWGDEPDGENDVHCVRVADFDRLRFKVNATVPTQRAVSRQHRNGRLLESGDLLLEKSGGGELQPVGAVMLYDLDLDAVCSNFVAKMAVVDGCDSRYLSYVHAALYFAGINKRSIKQTTGIQNLDSQAYLDEHIAYPPRAEQRAIASFLDRETAKIDGLVVKKERLIELLQEKRTALISAAVTKGLNPDAKMKESGIEWLGEVPEHWKIPPLYARYKVELGKMLDAKRITGDYLLHYLRNVDVQWDRVLVDNLPQMDFRPDEYSRFTLRDDDLLVCEGGEAGRTAIWKGELKCCGYQKAIHRLRPRNIEEHPRFLYYMMRHVASTEIFVFAGNPNTISHLTAEQLRVYRFPFPPSDEQKEIVKYLDAVTESIDRLVARIQDGIARLREYRTALISAAVTGKIDVREEVSCP